MSKMAASFVRIIRTKRGSHVSSQIKRLVISRVSRLHREYTPRGNAGVDTEEYYFLRKYFFPARNYVCERAREKDGTLRETFFVVIFKYNRSF